jgi:hypothetical protein
MNDNIYIISTCISCPECGGEPYKMPSVYEGVLNCDCLDCGATWYEHEPDDEDEED